MSENGDSDGRYERRTRGIEGTRVGTIHRFVLLEKRREGRTGCPRRICYFLSKTIGSVSRKTRSIEAFINVSPARFYRHTHISAQQCRARIPPPCPRTWAKYAGQIRISVSLSRLAITGPTLLHSSPIQMPTFLFAGPKRGISRFLHDSARETNEESFVLKLKAGDDEL